MTELRRCQYCGNTIIILYTAQHRFCSVACGNRWFSAERKQALAFFRAQGIEVVVPTRTG
jgi:hypothetical protein